MVPCLQDILFSCVLLRATKTYALHEGNSTSLLLSGKKFNHSRWKFVNYTPSTSDMLLTGRKKKWTENKITYLPNVWSYSPIKRFVRNRTVRATMQKYFFSSSVRIIIGIDKQKKKTINTEKFSLWAYCWGKHLNTLIVLIHDQPSVEGKCDFWESDEIKKWQTNVNRWTDKKNIHDLIITW